MEVFMAKFRKKPVVIDAEMLKAGMIEAHRLGDDGWPDPIWQGVMDNQIILYLDRANGVVTGHAEINTLEGTMRAKVGDYIIKGVHGEFYPCKPDIFAKTYDLVET
jgi:hypothetical protein